MTKYTIAGFGEGWTEEYGLHTDRRGAFSKGPVTIQVPWSMATMAPEYREPTVDDIGKTIQVHEGGGVWVEATMARFYKGLVLVYEPDNFYTGYHPSQTRIKNDS